MCKVDQGMHDALRVHITAVGDADITYCETWCIGQWQDQVPHGIWRELIEQGEVFMDILQRIIFSVTFEDARPSDCKVICMLYDGINRTPTYVTLWGGIQSGPQKSFKRYNGPIYLPPQIFKL